MVLSHRQLWDIGRVFRNLKDAVDTCNLHVWPGYTAFCLLVGSGEF
jgi:hypothetical protein